MEEHLSVVGSTGPRMPSLPVGLQYLWIKCYLQQRGLFHIHFSTTELIYKVNLSATSALTIADLTEHVNQLHLHTTLYYSICQQ